MSTAERKWVRGTLRKPLQFDALDVSASVLLGRRIDGLYVEEFKENLDIVLNLVEHLPYTPRDRTVKSFRFEGKETCSVDNLVRGEFDLIRQTGWIEVQRT